MPPSAISKSPGFVAIAPVIGLNRFYTGYRKFDGGWVRSEQSVGPLISALSDEDAEVRKATNFVLERITGKSFGFEAGGGEGERQAATPRWEEWWDENKDAFEAKPAQR